MKKTLTILLLFLASFSFAQNGFLYVDGGLVYNEGFQNYLPYPSENLTAVFDTAYVNSSGDLLNMAGGANAIYISGTGLDKIYDFSGLNDARFDKSNTTYWGSSLNAYFYHDAGNPYYSKLKDFHRYYLENQIADTDFNDCIFLKASATTNTSNVLDEVSVLVVYSSSLTDNKLSKTLSWIGIQADFYGDEMFDNYDFSTGNTTGWNFVDCTGNVGTYLGKNNVCLVTATNITTIYPRQFKTLTLNKTYRIEIEYYIPSSNGFTFDVRYGTSGQVLCKSDILDSWTNKICESKLTNIGDTGFVSLYRISASIGNVFYLKKVSIKEKYENYYKS